MEIVLFIIWVRLVIWAVASVNRRRGRVQSVWYDGVDRSAINEQIRNVERRPFTPVS